MRGRRPKPTVVRLLEGNAGHRPVNRREPRAPIGVPSCPKHLRGVARKTWQRIGGFLVRLQVVTSVDQDALELLVRAYGDYHRAQAVLERCGFTFTVRTESGRVIRPRPEVAIAAEAWKRTLRALTEFGLTPASRTRLETTNPDAGAPVRPDDPESAEDFIFGRKRRA